MRKIMLLDCTLRDGGYVNDWEFGHDHIVGIFERMASADVDIIEIGFLDQKRTFDLNRSIMPDTASVEKIYGGLDRKKSIVVGMIDYGTLDLSAVQPCKDSFLDGIRVIFKKHLKKEAMEYCRAIKKLGYKVFAQLVSITSYSDEELMEFIALANDVEPYAVSMVDTYGLCHKETILHYFEMLDKNLNPEISLGYHAHNNFQLGYANCLEILSKETDRQVLVDGTVYGMGKSAGNAPLELLAMYMNLHYGKNYDTAQILEAIDANIMPIFNRTPWGYNMFFYIAASHNCHPNYVQDLLGKRTLSIKSVSYILNQLEGEKKLLYNKEYIEKLYSDFQRKELDDKEDTLKLKARLAGRTVLLLGPSTSIVEKKEDIDRYIEKNHPVILSVNFIPKGIPIDYLFLSTSKRYMQLTSVLCKKTDFEIISTSNLIKTNGDFNYTFNYSGLIDEDAEIIDNSFIMALKLLKKLGYSEIAAAGFDGYRDMKEQNYINSAMDYHFNKSQAKKINAYVSDFLNKNRHTLRVRFVTDTLYLK